MTDFLRALHRVDQRAFTRLAEAHSPVLDATLPRLSHAANHSKLWVGAAGLMWLSGRRSTRRAALRGLVAVALTSTSVNGPLKQIARRKRPDRDGVPMQRLLRRSPTSPSFPSGHTASAAAFATAVAIEEPLLAAPLVAAAAAVGVSRVYTGAHYPGDVLAGAAIGAGVALATRGWWPVAPTGPARVRPSAHSFPAGLEHDGTGLVAVVNPSAGSSGPDVAEALREALPGAKVVVPGESDDLLDTLRSAAREATALAVAGGDGTINAAAGIAREHDLPLVVIAAGTLNHLARDLGAADLDAAVEAVRDGEVVEVDLGLIDDHVFLNTASLGGYPELVDARERWEHRLGKWPALALALVGVLREGSPVDVEIDGRRRRIWLLFAGNCRYEPDGVGPTWRSRLDDGLLDVRIVDATAPFARARLVLAALTGTLDKCRVHERRCVEELTVRVLDGAPRLARDGETFDGSADVVIKKSEKRLRLLVPREHAAEATDGAPSSAAAPTTAARV